jgi:hypothetical protein
MINSVNYAPAPVPSDPSKLQTYLTLELAKIQAAIFTLAAGSIDTTYTAPTRVQDGMIRLADGTHWNPGSGQGMYVYYNGGWHFLG